MSTLAVPEVSVISLPKKSPRHLNVQQIETNIAILVASKCPPRAESTPDLLHFEFLSCSHSIWIRVNRHLLSTLHTSATRTASCSKEKLHNVRLWDCRKYTASFEKQGEIEESF